MVKSPKVEVAFMEKFMVRIILAISSIEDFMAWLTAVMASMEEAMVSTVSKRFSSLSSRRLTWQSMSVPQHPG